MNILVLINPLAGGGKSLKHLPAMKTALGQSPHEFIWKVTDTPEGMRGAISRAVNEGIHCVLLMGGDGTVHEALPAIKQASVPFGLLPCGRGNDFARNIGTNLSPLKGCYIPADPLFLTLDLPDLNGLPFGSIACTGFDADVNKLAREKKGYFDGTMGYIVCVLRALKVFRPFRAEISIDDFRWTGRVMMVAISNGPHYGGGMKIAPNAMMDDGLFEVCIIGEVSKRNLLREFPKVFQGKHTTHPKVIMRAGARVVVKSDEQREVFADGEQVGELPCVATIGDSRMQVMQLYPLPKEGRE